MKNMLIILLTILAWTGCRPGRTRPMEKPVILVSILPQKGFVEKIGPDDFQVSVLIPHGANPTTYSLLPGQMTEISFASLWFRMGYVGFELSWGDRITETNPAMKTVDLSQGLPLIGGSFPLERDDRAGIDPHTWMSPANVKIMAATILEELTLLNPENREIYAERYRRFATLADSTDTAIREILKDCQGKGVITYHPSLTYFARDYGLHQHSVERGGKEPTPGHMAELTAIARRDSIRTIFIQSEFDIEMARVFAEEIDGEVIRIWPLNPEWSSNLIDIARLIRDK